MACSAISAATSGVIHRCPAYMARMVPNVPILTGFDFRARGRATLRKIARTLTAPQARKASAGPRPRRSRWTTSSGVCVNDGGEMRCLPRCAHPHPRAGGHGDVATGGWRRNPRRSLPR